MARVNKLIVTEMYTKDNLLMVYHKDTDNIDGQMDLFLKEILNKVTETVMVYGNLQIKNKGIEDTIYLIKGMDMELMNSYHTIKYIKDIIFRIYVMERDNF